MSQLGAETWIGAEVLAKNQHVVLGASNMVAGLIVTSFHERAKRRNCRTLCRNQLLCAVGQLIRLNLNFSCALGHQIFKITVLVA